MSARILLLEDDVNLKLILSRALVSAGYQVRATASIEAVLNWVRAGEGDLLLADVLLDGQNFLESLGLVKRLRSDFPVIVMSAQATASTAINAEKGGVFEYLPKPFDLDEMIASIARALGEGSPRRSAPSVAEPTGFVGQSTAIQATFKSIARAATSRAHVAILGETGVGKRRAAEALLQARGVALADAALITSSHSPQDIFASTSDAAHALWLRLDEWEPAQQRAARDALDAGAGRVIVTASLAAHERLDARLLARLSEGLVTIPPLRERRDDIATLAEALCGEFARRDGQAPVQLSPSALSLLESLPWPGNVAELRSVLSRVALATRGRKADAGDVTAAMRAPVGEHGDELGDRASSLASQALTGPDARQAAINALDRALFEQALAQADGNRSRAAELLGLNRNTLARRLAELEEG